MVRDNVFEDCSCSSIRWLWDAKYNAHVPNVTRTFYRALIDLNGESLCESHECHLPLQHVVELFAHDSEEVVCAENATFANMCEYVYDERHFNSISAAAFIDFSIVLFILCISQILFIPFLKNST
jgi:hypothetical protein